MTTVNSIATIIAAGAALVTIYFARQTVREAVKARNDGQKAHSEQLTAMQSVAQSVADQSQLQLAKMQDATNAATNEHHLAMAEQRRALEADLALRRQEQLEKVSELLLDLFEVARREYFEPPAALHLDGGSIVTTTRVPAIQLRLRTAVATLRQLGGPDLAHTLPESGRGDKDSSLRVWTGAIDAMAVIEGIARGGDPSLAIPPLA